MGLATGCIGMSLTDFERCTPSQFYAIADAWQHHQQSQQQAQWEQVRTLALCILQPHTTEHLKPTDIIHFPWDNEHHPDNTTPDTPPTPISDEELQRRYKEAAKARGLT